MGLPIAMDEHARYFKALRLKFPEEVAFYIHNFKDEKSAVIKEFIKYTISKAFMYKDSEGNELELSLEQLKNDTDALQFIFRPLQAEIDNNKYPIAWNDGWNNLKKHIESKIMTTK